MTRPRNPEREDVSIISNIIEILPDYDLTEGGIYIWSNCKRHWYESTAKRGDPSPCLTALGADAITLGHRYRREGHCKCTRIMYLESFSHYVVTITAVVIVDRTLTAITMHSESHTENRENHNIARSHVGYRWKNVIIIRMTEPTSIFWSSFVPLCHKTIKYEWLK